MFTPTPLNLPPYDARIRRGADGNLQIYDAIRRRYLTLTPEEWVRQHFCNYLLVHKRYPKLLLANEVSLNVGGVTRRCDSVLYHAGEMRPRMVVEYKAPHVAITEAVFTQIQSYNSVLRADYLVVSNGLQHYCCHVDYEHQTVHYLPEIPPYESL